MYRAIGMKREHTILCSPAEYSLKYSNGSPVPSASNVLTRGTRNWKRGGNTGYVYVEFTRLPCIVNVTGSAIFRRRTECTKNLGVFFTQTAVHLIFEITRFNAEFSFYFSWGSQKKLELLVAPFLKTPFSNWFYSSARINLLSCLCFPTDRVLPSLKSTEINATCLTHC